MALLFIFIAFLRLIITSHILACSYHNKNETLIIKTLPLEYLVVTQVVLTAIFAPWLGILIGWT